MLDYLGRGKCHILVTDWSNIFIPHTCRFRNAAFVFDQIIRPKPGASGSREDGYDLDKRDPDNISIKNAKRKFHQTQFSHLWTHNLIYHNQSFKQPSMPQMKQYSRQDAADSTEYFDFIRIQNKQNFNAMILYTCSLCHLEIERELDRNKSPDVFKPLFHRDTIIYRSPFFVSSSAVFLPLAIDFRPPGEWLFDTFYCLCRSDQSGTVGWG